MVAATVAKIVELMALLMQPPWGYLGVVDVAFGRPSRTREILKAIRQEISDDTRRPLPGVFVGWQNGFIDAWNCFMAWSQ